MNMKKPTYHIGHADRDSAFVTAASGHDIVVLRRLTVEMPDLPAENHISDDQWQRIIDVVDAAIKNLNPKPYND